DGKMDERLDQIKKIEKVARKITNKIKRNPYMTFSDDDGNNINQTPGKGLNFVPIKEWVEINEETISEDLAVWFGTKKKPKGSSQPKGPWVNICRKKEGGGHPPCGRPEASDDIAEVKWFNLTDLFEYKQEPSLGEGHVPPIKYTWKLEDKIVPEHIELMQTFFKKVVTDNLIKIIK
ncbi:MAG: hypothetical protein EBS55_14400, partial [Flavobacteriaceae bacterium]|nr:hypothetical protein [Flavobacteriaceae bacterium]